MSIHNDWFPETCPVPDLGKLPGRARNDLDRKIITEPDPEQPDETKN